VEHDPIADLGWGLGDIRRRLPQYAVWDRYMDGDHDMALTSERWRTTFGHVFRALAINLCPSVVAALADRIDIDGWASPIDPEDTAPGKDGPTSEAGKAEAAWGPLMRNAENQVTDDSLTFGDGFVTADKMPDGKAVLWPQNPGQIAVRYSTDRPGVIEMAVKVWPTVAGSRQCRYRANVYYEDQVFRFITSGKVQGVPDKPSKFVPFLTDDSPEGIIQMDLGIVPVFHFGNRARINCYGTSELSIVKPIQDALNKTVLDMLVGGEYVALPQRWATGITSDDTQRAADGTLTAKPRFRVGVDRVWTTPNNEADFGQLDPADMSNFVTVADFFKVTAAQVTGTPVHYMQLMGSTPPSGESLKTLDGRLVKRAERAQDGWGPQWERAQACMRALESGGAVVLDSGLSIVWRNPNVRNEKEDAEVALLKQQAGVGQARTLTEMGYSEDEVAQFMDEAKGKAADMLAASVAAFNAGNVPGVMPPAVPPPAPAVPPEA
jgi:hypothetical protein